MEACSTHPVRPVPPDFPAPRCAIASPGGCKEEVIDDSELLQRFVRDRSDAAFTELVRQKTALVYSAALRQVEGDTQLAQDVSQTVFIDLARKAPQLARRPVLASWLYTSTRFSALKALRAKRRRLHREQKAYLMDEIARHAPPEADWDQVRPLLDSAICDLAESDRAAILMRYLEGLPFAVMGLKLGIGESSARMRAERALEKLRAVLAKKGITSTAAALGLVLATKAVAAPPAGLAATLAVGALAPSAAVGGGAGLLVKLYKFSSMNKLQSGFAAVTVGTAGYVTTQADEKAHTTIFFIYAVCFGIGLVFTIISAIGAHALSGHVEVGHGLHAEAHAHDHATGSGTGDMPGFSPLSPTTISAFLTAFGGFGLFFSEIPATSEPWLGARLAFMGALGTAVGVFLLMSAIFRRTQASSEGRVAALAGLAATVITPIGPDSVGEIAYVQAGTRYSGPARSERGEAFPSGATVRIARVAGSQFFVIPA
jgi:RNA polymerase sigma factor (sigma-70 family)